jgi:hypothetical protein
MVRQLGGDLLQVVEEEKTWRSWVEIGSSALKDMDFVGFQHRLSDDLNEICTKLSLPLYNGEKQNVSSNTADFHISDLAKDLEHQRTRWDVLLYERALAEFSNAAQEQ